MPMLRFYALALQVQTLRSNSLVLLKVRPLSFEDLRQQLLCSIVIVHWGPAAQVRRQARRSSASAARRG
jgi:hypothetical protein